MTIFYKLFGGLYVNLTNACPCSCVFCIRNGGEGVGDAQSLWLEREPTLDEIKTAFDVCNLNDVTEIIFCGYGEPMERAETVIAVCEYIKSRCDLPIRINTNGLVRLINPDFDVSGLRIVDAVSVSLNADDEEEYLRVTRPRFGAGSYNAMLSFARESAAYTKVSFTIVNVLSEERTARCKQFAEDMRIPFRVREMM